MVSWYLTAMLRAFTPFSMFSRLWLFNQLLNLLKSHLLLRNQWRLLLQLIMKCFKLNRAKLLRRRGLETSTSQTLTNRFQLKIRFINFLI